MSADNPTRGSRPRDEALSRFLDGEPEPGDAEILLEAMRQDPGFADQIAHLLAVDDLLRQGHEPDPTTFAEALRSRLDAEENADPFIRSVLDRIGPQPAQPARPRRGPWRQALPWMAAAGALLLGLLTAWGAWQLRKLQRQPASQEIAWLTNAQSCRWAEDGQPAGGLSPGKVLHLEQGLAELSFANGVRVILKGPVTLEVQSVRSVRLLHGSMAVHVPEEARGFEVLSPTGKVVDLGTEFGIQVAEDGSARVQVFRGEVQVAAEDRPAAGLSVKERQSAYLDWAGASLLQGPAGAVDVVREIPSPAVPRTRRLDFRQPAKGTLLDTAGVGTGLTHRLPGTGAQLPARDPNLRLDAAGGRLLLKTTENDLNNQHKIGRGEYLGLRLSDLGFTGAEDFSVTAVFPATPGLDAVDQFGLYAGARSDRHIRGGLLRRGEEKGIGPATQFFVGNNGGRDAHLYMVGLVSRGDNLAMTLQRIGGKYSLTVANQTTGESTTLAIRHPAFLDTEPDLYVGVFGANPWRPVARTLALQELRATVWVRQP
jgi:hypothetical protein